MWTNMLLVVGCVANTNPTENRNDIGKDDTAFCDFAHSCNGDLVVKAVVPGR
jgi:hypothetical protein